MKRTGMAWRLTVMVTFGVLMASARPGRRLGRLRPGRPTPGARPICRIARVAICRISGDAMKRRNSPGRTSSAPGAREPPTTCSLLSGPPCRRAIEGNLGDENYVNLVAFLLSANGARAGDQPLTAAARVAIGSVANRGDAGGSSKNTREHHRGCAGPGHAACPADGAAGDGSSEELRAGHR